MPDNKPLVGTADAIASADPGVSGFTVENYPFAYLSRASARYNARLTEALRKVKLDQPSWRVLMILRETASASISDLVDRTAVKQPTLTRIIQRMRRDGLVVTVTRRDDQRVVDVAATEEGRLAIERARPVASQIYRRGTNGLSEAEAHQLISLLSRIEQNLAKP